jgi:HKD family nuclease
MYVINQPWRGRGYQMGDYLIRFLQAEPPFEVFRASVAFVKASGMLRLVPSLRTFMERGGRVEIVAGIDDGITTRQALELIAKYSTTAYVFNNPMTTFHPKVYLFETFAQRAVAFVGSSNLTVGGLFTNYEANIGLEFDLKVPSDRVAYDSILAAFRNAIDPATGNAIPLNSATLDDLTRANKIPSETRRASVRLSDRHGEVPLFPRTPVPPAPPVDPDLIGLIPKFKPSGDLESDQRSVAQFRPWSQFVMTLGERDTRQQAGYSRDVYIPLAARNFNRQFWGWPNKFKPGSAKTVGTYLERRITMLIRPVTGGAQVAENVRLYYYEDKREFRLNCGRLVTGARAGDLLIIQKSLGSAVFEGRAFEFEATVLPTNHPKYASFVKECNHQIGTSAKRWGYV